MLSKCANPACAASFRKLGIGKLFLIDRPDASQRSARLEFYWLCPECAPSMHVVIGLGAVPSVETKAVVEKAAAAAA
jgi:hypothetical protein